MSYGTDVAQEAHDLLCTLARIPAPSHDEGRRAQFVRDWLIGQGLDAEIDDALNVTSSYGVGIIGRIALFSAHTDVVFPDTDPLPLVEQDGRIQAPGVGDDTANLVCLLLAYRELLRRIRTGELKRRRAVMIAANSCEEGLGNLDGMKALFARVGRRIETFVSLDGYAPHVVTRPVGSHRWRISCDTPGGHSYAKFGSPNAIERLSAFICAFYQLERPDEEPVTVNVGRIEGGTTVNSIAQHAEALIEYRSVSEACLATMRERVERLVEQSDAEDVRFTLELIGERPGEGPIDPVRQNALMKACEQAVVETLGEQVQWGPSSTDANVPFSLGIPATTVGAIRGAGAHTREEWIDVASLAPGVDCALALMERLVCA
ncbi:MAG: M20/M25/M40 family metallo-hydrolase [Atopobiaceae bacterium]|nr:M20/M25/M40 family metallo-hydrolase [Atopobiaceae bacterium]